MAFLQVLAYRLAERPWQVHNKASIRNDLTPHKRKIMIRILLSFTLVFATFAAPSFAAEKKVDEKWISLFNGKDLSDWTIKIKGYPLGENFGDTFRVEDGLMKVRYDQYDKFDRKFGHIFYKKPYSHYVLRVEYRFVGDQAPEGEGWALRNSGAMLHGEAPETMGVDQDFPVSVEVQFLGGNGKDKRTTANLCTPGTNVVMDGKLFKPHCTTSKSPTFHGDQWVTVEIEVRGNEVMKHIINGETVLEYTQPQLDERDAHAKELAEKAGDIMLSGGTISLQSESHPIDFRKVELKVLEE
ncbi:DUF1080 domain-containing protein [Rubinisphaera sp.]|uniref:3-keto-disaccharide hydrolase n=1 Tax=Rubinisphaera sp. TaxID=2024857 RepID=UPI0025D0769A|nr:DUF1080 domain-containing protein [Rubinisphaera sp.]|tara:strand:+ start:12761 stop:13654 length:894 start_codon:yes stop_codon:yes gene_type:complete